MIITALQTIILISHFFGWGREWGAITNLEYSGKNSVLEHVAASGSESILIELQGAKMFHKGYFLATRRHKTYST